MARAEAANSTAAQTLREAYTLAVVARI